MSPVSSPSLSHEKGAKMLQDAEKGHGEHDLRQKQQGEGRGWQCRQRGRARAGMGGLPHPAPTRWCQARPAFEAGDGAVVSRLLSPSCLPQAR